MTAEERREWNKMKAAVVGRLSAGYGAALSTWRGLLDDTDTRLLVYTSEVVHNTDGHNLYELLAVERFFAMLGRHPWDVKRVRRFIKFYECLKFNGATGRQRYKLTPVQVFQFANIFGFSTDDGRRLIRLAYIFVPRKFSKTTSAAALAVYDLLFGDSNAQAYVGANSYEQAKICFDEIRAIMRDIDRGERHFRVNREKISYKDGKRDSFARCLTANAKTQDGLNASLVIMDEYAQARNTAGRNGADLKNTLTSSMGTRREPLTLIITTASDVIEGAFKHELDGVMSVLRGEAENDAMFAALFMPDADDEEDNPKTWAKVQPHLGVTVRPEFYAQEYAAARLSAEGMQAFRTKQLNIFAAKETEMWISGDKARELCAGFDITKAQGFPVCAVAFDLSIRDDFSAVAYTVFKAESKRFYSHVDYYFPRGALAGHPNEQLYRRWYEEGALRLCAGDVIDVRQIADDILGRAKYLNIVRVGYDAWKAKDLVNILSNVSTNIVQSYSQTYGSFNLPVEAFELLAYADPPKITLNANPINVFCLSNCVIDTDRMENRKPIKASQFRKIDGVIAVLMTLGLLYRLEE